MDLGLQYAPPPSVLVSAHCMPRSYSHYLQILFNLINPFFPCPSSFPYFFHSGSHYFFFWHSCCIHPFSISSPSSSNWFDKFCSACPFKCILYLLIGSFASFLLLLWDHNFYHSIPLEQRFSNFFQVGTTFISQNVLRTTLLLGLSNSLGLP